MLKGKVHFYEITTKWQTVITLTKNIVENVTHVPENSGLMQGGWDVSSWRHIRASNRHKTRASSKSKQTFTTWRILRWRIGYLPKQVGEFSWTCSQFTSGLVESGVQSTHKGGAGAYASIWYSVDWHLVRLSEHLTKLEDLHKLPMKLDLLPFLSATNQLVGDSDEKRYAFYGAEKTHRRAPSIWIHLKVIIDVVDLPSKE